MTGAAPTPPVFAGRRGSPRKRRSRNSSIGCLLVLVQDCQVNRLVARPDERLNQLQPLGELLRLQFRGRFRDLLAQLLGLFLQIELEQVSTAWAIGWDPPRSECPWESQRIC